MTNLNHISTEELEKELQRRGKHTTTGICPTCRKWTMEYKHYSGYGEAWHCVGCCKRVENCTCRH